MEQSPYRACSGCGVVLSAPSVPAWDGRWPGVERPCPCCGAPVVEVEDGEGTDDGSSEA